MKTHSFVAADGGGCEISRITELSVKLVTAVASERRSPQLEACAGQAVSQQNNCVYHGAPGDKIPKRSLLSSLHVFG